MPKTPEQVAKEIICNLRIYPLGGDGEEIRIMTNSVWPSVLMQTAGGAFIGAIVLKDVIKVSSGMDFLFAPVLEGGLCIVLFLLSGVGIYLVRRKSEVLPIV